MIQPERIWGAVKADDILEIDEEKDVLEAKYADDDMVEIVAFFKNRFVRQRNQEYQSLKADESRYRIISNRTGREL